MHNFRQLDIWKESMALAKKTYITTDGFPTEERFGLTSQLRRCCVSIPSNIAEGSSRNSSKEFAYFLRVALGSSFELETQLTLANEVGFIASDELTELNKQIIVIQKKK